jgi:hypothetical protein
LRSDHPPLSERRSQNLRVVAAANSAGASIHVIPSGTAEAAVYLAAGGVLPTAPASVQARPREHSSSGSSSRSSPPSTGDPPRSGPARAGVRLRTNTRHAAVASGWAHADLDAQLEDALADDEGRH